MCPSSVMNQTCNESIELIYPLVRSNQIRNLNQTRQLKLCARTESIKKTTPESFPKTTSSVNRKRDA